MWSLLRLFLAVCVGQHVVTVLKTLVSNSSCVLQGSQARLEPELLSEGVCGGPVASEQKQYSSSSPTGVARYSKSLPLPYRRSGRAILWKMSPTCAAQHA